MVTHDNCTFSTNYQKNSKEKKWNKFQQYIWLPVQIFSCYSEILWKLSMIKVCIYTDSKFQLVPVMFQTLWLYMGLNLRIGCTRLILSMQLKHLSLGGAGDKYYSLNREIPKRCILTCRTVCFSYVDAKFYCDNYGQQHKQNTIFV